jgi:hypothetical protein
LICRTDKSWTPEVSPELSPGHRFHYSWVAEPTAAGEIKPAEAAGRRKAAMGVAPITFHFCVILVTVSKRDREDKEYYL